MDGGVQISSVFLDRGYIFEPIISALLKVRRGDMAKLMDILATARNYSATFNPQAPWRLGAVSSNSNNTGSVKAGKPFCIEGAQCALGAT